VSGLDPDLREQLGDGVFTLAEQFQDPDTDRVAEGFEEVGLELVQRSAHYARLPGSGAGR
jgi:hypothetical protein